MTAFGGFNQADKNRVADSDGDELLINPDGSINVNATISITDVEISNDSGNPIPVSGTVTITDGSGPVTVDGTVASAESKAEDAPHSSGDTGYQMLGVRNDTAAVRTSADGDYSAIATDSAGRVGIADLGGSISIDDNGGSLTVDGTVTATLVPGTSGGESVYRNINLGASGVNVKASAGQVFGWYIYNNATSTRYVKIYNKATAPTVGTDVPVLTLGIPAGGAANVEYANGMALALGIGIAATTGVADANTGAPAANDVVVNLMWK